MVDSTKTAWPFCGRSLDNFSAANPNFDLKSFSFLKVADVEALDWQDVDRDHFLPQLKALQRLFRLTNDREIAIALFDHGIHSALQIADIPKHRFIAEHRDLFHGDRTQAATQASDIHARALAVKTKVVLTYTSITQHQASRTRTSRSDNLSRATTDHFNEVPSYEDLFGGQDFCTCEDCRSILSPAAYFVDLMRIQDQYIEKSSKPPIKARLLSERREDLWNLELSCDNTNQPISKLSIVNQLLQARFFNPFPDPQVQPAQPVLLLTFENNNFEDQSGNQTMVGADGSPEFSADGLNGNPGMKFPNGSDLFANFMADDSHGSYAFCFAAWVKYEEKGSPHHRFITYPNLTRTFELYLNKEDYLAFGLGKDKFQSTSKIKIGVWQHVAVVVNVASDETVVTFYMNGIQDSTHTSPQALGAFKGLVIGDLFSVFRPNSSLDGILGKFWAFDTAIDSDQMKELVAQDQALEAPIAYPATQGYPFNLPFIQPLEEIRLYMTQNHVSLQGLWSGLSTDTEQSKTPTYLETLAISPWQWSVISTIDQDTTSLNGFYGLAPNSDPIELLTNADRFLLQTGLGYPLLNTLLYEDLSNAELDKNLNNEFFINHPCTHIDSDALYLTTDKGPRRILNLTNARLDRIHRFIRLANILGWSYTDLDWALRTIADLRNEKASLIDTHALPYLAWMKTLINSRNFSVNQCCGILGFVKSVGRKFGPTFFDQVFSDPSRVPNPPQWQDGEGRFDLVWSVPEVADTQNPSKDELQIRTALTAALQVSQDECLEMANLVLSALDITDRQLPLTLNNLSILYRLSMLPRLTGLSINECLVLIGLPETSDDNKETKSKRRRQLASANGVEAFQMILYLERQAPRLKASDFSVYQIQYILTGQSDDPRIQNRILGPDLIANFLRAFAATVTSAFLTESLFLSAIGTLLTQTPQGGDAAATGNKIYQALQSGTSAYLDANGIVLQWAQAETIKTIVMPCLPKGTTDQLTTEISTQVAETINQAAAHQQNSLSQSLAGLYNISPNLVPALEVWVGLILSDLTKSDAGLANGLPNLKAAAPLLVELYTAATSNEADEKATTHLVLMQQYAELMREVDLTQAESQALINHPHIFNIDIMTSTNPHTPQTHLTMANLEALKAYKHLVADFQDRQNHILNYFQFVTKYPGKKKAAALALEAVTGWDPDQIYFLYEHLWTGTASGVPQYGTALGLDLLYRWFETATRLNLGTQDLWQLTQLQHIGSQPLQIAYAAYRQASDMVWGGLQKEYGKRPEVLTALQNTVNETVRDAIVPLTIFNLREGEGLPLQHSRDLSDYLLIDVDVEGVVQTSYIKEAISAVQLYIYRCFNHLEQGIEVLADLKIWWPWIQQYRVWQANREVFLFPENYIEPELRKDPSPEFSKLQNDLQQIDPSDIDHVDDAFRDYLDQFSLVADLEVVGAGAQDYEVYSDDDLRFSATKGLALVGRTRIQPFVYYFRTVLCLPDHQFSGNRFHPVHWGSWRKIDFQIHPEGPVNTVFAFGKWYLFWVEQIQTGQTAEATGKSAAETTTSEDTPVQGQKLYAARIMYAFQNHAGNWTPPHTLAETPLRISGQPGDINTMDQRTRPFWDRVYPVYLNSARTILVPYGKAANAVVFELGQGLISQGALAAYPFVTQQANTWMPAPLTTVYSTGSFRYKYELPATDKPLDDKQEKALKTFSLWFYLNQIPRQKPVSLFSNNLTITPEGRLNMLGEEGRTEDLGEIQAQRWYHLAAVKQQNDMRDRSHVFNLPNGITIHNTPSYAAYNNAKYAAWTTAEPGKIGALQFGKISADGSGVPDSNKVDVPNAKSRVSPAISVLESQLFLAWSDENSFIQTAVYDLSKGKWTRNPGLADSSNSIYKTNVPPNLCTHQSKVYIAWSDTGNDLHFGTLNARNSTVTSPQKIGDGSWTHAPSLTSNGQDLFFFYHFKKVFEGSGTYRGFMLSKLNGSTNLTHLGTQLELSPTQSPSLIFFQDQLNIVFKNGQSKPEWSLITWPDESSAKNFTRSTLTFNEQKSFDQSLSQDVIFLPTTPSSQSRVIATAFSGNIDQVLVGLDPKVFLNGQGVGGSPIPFSGDGDKPQPNLEGFDGSIQELLFFNRELSPAEITSLYENGRRHLHQFFEAVVKPGDAFGNRKVSSLPILGQTNAYIATQERAEFLALPFTTSTNQAVISCFRLNTTAIPALSQRLFQTGIDSLLSIPAQKEQEYPFYALGPNTSYILSPWPSDAIDFSNSAMSRYYWELFFQAPFLVARELQRHLQFESAKKWYEYIYNPTVIKADQHVLEGRDNENDKYWRFLGLRAENNPILQEELGETWSREVQQDTQDPAQLFAYHNDPFDPHAIAALRPIAYQKSIVMHYIDNLLDWGDALFRRFSIESIQEATMLYMTAYDLLGRQPRDLGPCDLRDPQTLEELGGPSEVAEFLVGLEQNTGNNYVPARDNPNNYIPGSYFGLPDNLQLISYWDRVNLRLYNIRNGLNFNGKAEQPPLFEAPIDPRRLVEAVTGGAPANQAAGLIQPSVPFYRFSVLLQKAAVATNTVLQLGQSLLAALEKKDAEQLTLVYNANQQTLISMDQRAKQDAVDAAGQEINAMNEALKAAEERLTFYEQLISRGLSGKETDQINLMISAISLMSASIPLKMLATPGHITPSIFGTAVGGMKWGDAINQVGILLENTGQVLNNAASLVGTKAGFQRREEDWIMQRTQSEREVTRIQYEIAAAKSRQDLADQELRIEKQTLDQEKKIETFLKNKFTSQELYQWMAGKLSALYFQAYQSAYSLAVKAQQAWRFERGLDQTFILPMQWDDLHQGLLAGETLQVALQQMENAFIDQNFRRLEIEKTISLAQLEPEQLIRLRSSGDCNFSLLEKDFDFDFPGHYCRQIKTISLSFPALLGPYQNIHATLTQNTNQTLLKPEISGVEYLLDPKKTQPTSNVLRVDTRNNQQVALSRGRNDFGLFEVGFNDDRYLPFEGTGAVSTWTLSLPKAYNRFDFSSLTDVVIRLQYTAVEGGASFRSQVVTKLPDYQGSVYLSMAQSEPAAWCGFVQNGRPLVFTTPAGLFAPNLTGYKAQKLGLTFELTEAGRTVNTMPQLTLKYGSQVKIPFQVKKDQNSGLVYAITGTKFKPFDLDLTAQDPWQLIIDSDSGGLITPEHVSGLILMNDYSAGIPR